MKSFINIDKLKSENNFQLSHAEIAVLQLLMKGLIRRQIAEQLNLSVHTVNTHIENVYKKLGVHSEIAAIAKLFSEHLIINEDKN